MTTRLSTGIATLDDRLDGGFRPGSLVLVAADPVSQAERLVTRLAAPRPTVYLSTRRSTAAVVDAFDRADVDATQVRFVSADDDWPVDHALDLAHSMTPGSTFVVDPVDALERLDESHYWSFLDELRAAVTATDSVAVLHGIAGDSPPPLRAATAYAADVVVTLSTTSNDRSIETRLLVPKVRGGTAITRALTLDFDADITVDTSRQTA